MGYGWIRKTGWGQSRSIGFQRPAPVFVAPPPPPAVECPPPAAPIIMQAPAPSLEAQEALVAAIVAKVGGEMTVIPRGQLQRKKEMRKRYITIAFLRDRTEIMQVCVFFKS